MANEKQYLGVLQIDYIRYIRAHLNHCGAWPIQEFGEKGSLLFSKIKRVFFLLISLCAAVHIATVLNLCRKKVPAEVFGQCVMQAALLITTLQRFSVPLFSDFYKYLEMMIKEMNLYHFKDKSEYATEIYNKVNRICKIVAVTYYVMWYGGLVIAQSGETISNYKEGVFTADPSSNLTVYTLICIYMPFSMYSNLLYVITFPIILYIVYLITSYPILTYDLVLFVSLSTMWGHVKILKHDLATFPRPQMEKNGTTSVWNPAWYSKEESVMVKQRLVAMIKHHRLMKEFSKASSDIYGMMLLCYYACLQILQISLLFILQEITVELLAKFGLLFLLSLQLLAMVSTGLELVASESEDLWTAVYDLPWECMDVSNRRLVFFFMCNTQKNMGFKAKDLLNVGVRTALSIFKTSWSCFLLLRTLNQTKT